MSGSAPPSGPAPRPWHLTTSAVSRLFVGVGLVLAGLVVGRSDVAVLGVPLVLAVVWGLAHRPAGATTADMGDPRFDRRRQRIEADLRLRVPAGTSVVHLRVGAAGHRDREALVSGDARRVLPLSFSTRRTGRVRAFVVDHADRGADGVRHTEAATVGPATVLVLPDPAPLKDLPLPFRLRGVTGAHHSARPGDGGDFRDVAAFAPGDRLRRIDWKATARRAGSPATRGTGTLDLYVRRTFATSEASVMLVLDARDAVGSDVAEWSAGEVRPDEPTSLDVARRAAASVARRYLDQGDRVGLVDPDGQRRLLRPAGGRRQLTRILDQLAVAGPQGMPARRLRAPRIPVGALVVVFSTFLDDAPADLLRMWRHAGHRTVAVDVLPAPSDVHLPPRARTALRIVRMERADRIAALASAGADVVTWDDGGDPAAARVALAALARVRRGRR